MSRISNDSAQLAQSLTSLANTPDVTITKIRDWCSATFQGHRVEYLVTLTGSDQANQARCIKEALGDHAFNLPRQIVADILVADIIEQPDGRTALVIEALLLDD
jgi:hypothetical protein